MRDSNVSQVTLRFPTEALTVPLQHHDVKSHNKKTRYLMEISKIRSMESDELRKSLMPHDYKGGDLWNNNFQSPSGGHGYTTNATAAHNAGGGGVHGDNSYHDGYSRRDSRGHHGGAGGGHEVNTRTGASDSSSGSLNAKSNHKSSRKTTSKKHHGGNDRGKSGKKYRKVRKSGRSPREGSHSHRGHSIPHHHHHHHSMGMSGAGRYPGSVGVGGQYGDGHMSTSVPHILGGSPGELVMTPPGTMVPTGTMIMTPPGTIVPGSIVPGAGMMDGSHPSIPRTLPDPKGDALRAVAASEEARNAQVAAAEQAALAAQFTPPGAFLDNQIGGFHIPAGPPPMVNNMPPMLAISDYNLPPQNFGKIPVRITPEPGYVPEGYQELQYCPPDTPVPYDIHPTYPHDTTHTWIEKPDVKVHERTSSSSVKSTSMDERSGAIRGKETTSSQSNKNSSRKASVKKHHNPITISSNKTASTKGSNPNKISYDQKLETSSDSARRVIAVAVNGGDSRRSSRSGKKQELLHTSTPVISRYEEATNSGSSSSLERRKSTAKTTTSAKTTSTSRSNRKNGTNTQSIDSRSTNYSQRSGRVRVQQPISSYHTTLAYGNQKAPAMRASRMIKSSFSSTSASKIDDVVPAVLSRGDTVSFNDSVHDAPATIPTVQPHIDTTTTTQSPTTTTASIQTPGYQPQGIMTPPAAYPQQMGGMNLQGYQPQIAMPGMQMPGIQMPGMGMSSAHNSILQAGRAYIHPHDQRYLLIPICDICEIDMSAMTRGIPATMPDTGLRCPHGLKPKMSSSYEFEYVSSSSEKIKSKKIKKKPNPKKKKKHHTTKSTVKTRGLSMDVDKIDDDGESLNHEQMMHCPTDWYNKADYYPRVYKNQEYIR